MEDKVRPDDVHYRIAWEELSKRFAKLGECTSADRWHQGEDFMAKNMISLMNQLVSESADGKSIEWKRQS